MALFSAQGLEKRFGDHVVLQGISLEVGADEIVGLMGPNGAGKTTCFNVLTGRYRPDAGRVTFDGVDITGWAPRKLARLGIARSFQMMNLFNDESARVNVMLALATVRQRGFSMWRDLARDKASIDAADQLLAEVGLAGKEALEASRLSYGDRRALEIAVALASKPRLLFLDEPTAGLGVAGTARLAELVGTLKRRVAMVIIEHDMRFLFSLADRIGVIHWGQIVAQGTPAELRANPWVGRSRLGRAA